VIAVDFVIGCRFVLVIAFIINKISQKYSKARNKVFKIKAAAYLCIFALSYAERKHPLHPQI
jgi:hypothetical protein